MSLTQTQLIEKLSTGFETIPKKQIKTLLSTLVEIVQNETVTIPGMGKLILQKKELPVAKKSVKTPIVTKQNKQKAGRPKKSK